METGLGKLLRVPCVLHVRANLHRSYGVLTLLRVALAIEHVHFVLVNPVSNAIADGKQLGVLGIDWTDVVHDAIALQNVLLTQHLCRILVLAVGAQDFARHALAALFGRAAGRRVHGKQHAFVVAGRVLRQGNRRAARIKPATVNPTFMIEPP